MRFVRGRTWIGRAAVGGLLAALFIAALLAVSTAATGAPPVETAGRMVIGEPAARETTDQIMEREFQRRLNPPPPHPIRPELRVEREGLPQNPDSPAVSQWPPQPASSTAIVEENISRPGPKLPQTVALSFLAGTWSDLGQAFPPDTMGAAGPTQYLLTVNTRIRVFDKTTGAIGPLDADFDVFFSSVLNGKFTTDPRVRFDRLSNRWFVVMINVDVPNRVLLAVSDGPTITGSTVWSFFFFTDTFIGGGNPSLGDYPTLGIDPHALYIGVNQFSGPDVNTANTFTGTSLYVVNKNSLLSGGPIIVTTFDNLTGTPTGAGPFTPHGCDNYDPSATTGYVIGVDNAVFGRLVLRRVSDPGGTPTLSGNLPISVPTTRFPITVPHLGNTGGNNGKLDALDDRLYAAHIRNGRLWTAHNIEVNKSGIAAVGARDGIRWYEVKDVDTTPTLAQSGTVFDTANTNARSYFIPSVMVSGQGHVAMGSSTAGSSEFANAFATGRLVGDPLGTTRNSGVVASSATYTSSTTAYNPPGDPGGTGGRRWGDYSYTSLDPCDDMTMWTVQEFCASTNIYGVQVAKLLAPPPATPASCNPAGVNTGLAQATVTLAGTVVNGSGFYDPGAGFPCRVTAAVSGGVTVLNTTFTDATHLNIEVSTLGASPGRQTITVTNPDGQSLASGLGVICVNPVVTASNNGPLDPGATLQLNASTIAGATYSWTGPDGFSSTLQNPTISNVTSAAAGTYSVTATVDTCISDPAQTTVTINGTSGPLGWQVR